MPDPFRLPRIKTLDRLVDALGRPSVSFVKWWNVDVAGSIERQEAAQGATDALLADAITDIAEAVGLATDATDAVADLADGTTAFTGVNVGGTNVKPFLDKTNGSALNDPTALGASVVETGAVAANAINVPGYAFTSAGAVISADETVVQTLVITTNGGAVQVSVGVILSCGGTSAITGSVFIKRDGTTIWSETVTIAALTAPGVYTMLESFDKSIPDTPSSGSHTYALCVSFSDYTGSPQASARGLSLHLFKDAP